jgi:hypothetical protein
MGNTSEKKNALVLTDGKGNWYAVPTEILEQHKVTGDRKAEIERLFGDTASGFSFEALDPRTAMAADPTEAMRPQEAASWAHEASYRNAARTELAQANTASLATSTTQMFGLVTALSANILGALKKE